MKTPATVVSEQAPLNFTFSSMGAVICTQIDVGSATFLGDKAFDPFVQKTSHDDAIVTTTSITRENFRVRT
jgi:hypothetical protein